jgi:hypothetical protein
MRRGRNETGHSTSRPDRPDLAFALFARREAASLRAERTAPVDVDVTRCAFTVNQTWPVQRRRDGLDPAAGRLGKRQALIASPLMTDFADAAFGKHPGRWPLPPATAPADLWLRAVAAGGQGRYGAAVADLDALGRTHTGGALASLAHSTRASFLRQLGGHRVARGWDGRAWAAAGPDVTAGTDALVGLAADALGVGRFALSAQLLLRAGDLLGAGIGRLPVRLAWVSAELAMFTGDGPAAVAHAERAVDLASELGSARHDTKSRVVLAAALCSTGNIEASRTVADSALATAAELGLVPLSWAVARLLADIGSAVHSPAQIATVRDASADLVGHRGGAWTAR